MNMTAKASRLCAKHVRWIKLWKTASLHESLPYLLSAPRTALAWVKPGGIGTAPAANVPAPLPAWSLLEVF